MSKKIQIPYKFECRDYQVPVWEALRNGKKRVVCCWHRGAGKDLFALNYFIWRMIKEPAVYLHCFPQYSQGKRAIWNSVHNTDDGESMHYLDHFPADLVKYKNSTEMRIELFNGSIYCVMGIDGKNAQLARGMNPTHVIMSEYAYMAPESWNTIRPRVEINNGSVLFLSTPNGQNHFYSLFNYASSGHDPDYFGNKLTIVDTKSLPESAIEKARAEGVPEDFIQQEYYCSFTRGAEGSYYGKLIQRCRDEDRISNISVSNDLPCFTSWDIGIGDSTAIWIFQQLNNGKINVLHYYENNSEGLDHYIHYLDNWKAKHKIVWGSHYVPHDMQNREFTSGVDRLTAARNMGYNMQVCPRKSIEEGIQAVRSLLPHCSFHQIECNRGIKCLDLYRKKWNEALKVYYDEPLHDQYSHGADAFRMAAIGIKSLGGGVTKLTSDQINDMRKRNLGY